MAWEPLTAHHHRAHCSVTAQNGTLGPAGSGRQCPGGAAGRRDACTTEKWSPAPARPSEGQGQGRQGSWGGAPEGSPEGIRQRPGVFEGVCMGP